MTPQPLDHLGVLVCGVVAEDEEMVRSGAVIMLGEV